jgi:hypothetical protein
VLEDPPLQVVHLGPGLEAQLLDESLARELERVERVGLTPGAVEGKHQAREQTFTQRMLVDKLLEFGRKVGAVTECELCLEPRLQRGQPEFLEPLSVGFNGLVVEQVPPGRPAPQLERDGQLTERLSMIVAVGRCAGSSYQPLELVDIELSGLEPHDVSARPSKPACVRSTSSPPRSRTSTANWPSGRSPTPRSNG